MTNILSCTDIKQFGWYVWKDGNKTKFYNRRIAIAYMQEIEGLLVKN